VNDWHLTITAKRTYKAIREGWPVIVNTGGARSGKTFGTVQLLLAIADTTPGVRISCVSRSLPHVKKGVFRDFQTIVRKYQYGNGEMRWTDFTYHLRNGSYIEFFGLEDPDKAHGPGRDILFINEANFVPKAVYDQLAMRTTGTILLDLNPSEFNSWVYTVADDPANKNIHSTYKDNLANLSQQQIAFIEKYEHLPDPFMWQVYGLGLRGASADKIFRHWDLIDELPAGGVSTYGLDFGFVHPSALIHFKDYEGGIYLDEVIYRSSLTKPELFNMIAAAVPPGATVYGDSSEADSIEELYRMGLNIHKANKDVWNGILTMKSHPLFITRRSVNLIREMQSYRWKTDRNDIVLDEPVKELDDAVDAARYAVHSYFTKAQIIFEAW
jgi:phage terminase large subunit